MRHSLKQAKISLTRLLALAGVLTISSPVQATLTSFTGADGVGLVYSSIGNVTWTQDANLFKTLSDADSTLISRIAAVTPSYNDSYWGLQTIDTDDFNTSTGLMSWWGAKAFVNYLNSINYGGSQQWALPSAGTNPQVGFGINGTAFEKLFYNELGGVVFNKIPNTDTFNNEQASFYWLATGFSPTSSVAWAFETFNGEQIVNSGKPSKFFAWAASPGQVGAVPVPGAIWLFGTGLVGLLGLKRRRA